jgi:hypothetical protein
MVTYISMKIHFIILFLCNIFGVDLISNHTKYSVKNKKVSMCLQLKKDDKKSGKELYDLIYLN